MNRLLFLAVILTALTGCDSRTPEPPVSAPMSSGLDLDDVDGSVRPQDDFYRFVNAGWLERTEIPPERASYGAFVEVHERNEKRLKTILEEAASADTPQGSDKQLIGNFYTSYMDQARASELGLEPLAEMLATIDDARTHDDVLRCSANLSAWISNIRSPTTSTGIAATPAAVCSISGRVGWVCRTGTTI